MSTSKDEVKERIAVDEKKRSSTVLIECVGKLHAKWFADGVAESLDDSISSSTSKATFDEVKPYRSASLATIGFTLYMNDRRATIPLSTKSITEEISIPHLTAQVPIINTAIVAAKLGTLFNIRLQTLTSDEHEQMRNVRNTPPVCAGIYYGTVLKISTEAIAMSLGGLHASIIMLPTDFFRDTSVSENMIVSLMFTSK